MSTKQILLPQRLLLLLSLLALVGANPLQASDPESRVKAAIVYKITKFASWPEKRPTLLLCILGEGSVNAELAKINGRVSLGRTIVTSEKTLAEESIEPCDIVYLHGLDRSSTRSVIKQLQDRPVLAISDQRSFVESGGMIGLERKGKKIGFAINETTTERSGIEISSQLKGLARVVR